MIPDAAKDWLRLSMAQGVGPVLGRKLVRAFGGIDALWSATPAQIRDVEGVGARLQSALQQSRRDHLQSITAYCRQHQIELVSPDDPRWPKSLNNAADAPLVLFVRGQAACLDHARLLAVVGARKASREGRLITRRWCRYFSQRGVAIVSGMAYGIDSAAHGGALEGDSPTLAVLGCGLARLGDEQKRQVEAVSRQGCVISELLPQVSASPELFPRRNRIIAGLAQATLVMEADVRSGSLITARQALDYGREVLAVPGSVLGGNHAGCHQLIRDGAVLAESADEVLRHMSWQGEGAVGKSYAPASHAEALLLQKMGREIMHLDQLAETCSLTVSELSPILLRLELQGVLERLPGSRYLLACVIQQ
jgi:DNA processing protein